MRPFTDAQSAIPQPGRLKCIWIPGADGRLECIWVPDWERDGQAVAPASVEPIRKAS